MHIWIVAHLWLIELLLSAFTLKSCMVTSILLFLKNSIYSIFWHWLILFNQLVTWYFLWNSGGYDYSWFLCTHNLFLIMGANCLAILAKWPKAVFKFCRDKMPRDSWLSRLDSTLPKVSTWILSDSFLYALSSFSSGMPRVSKSLSREFCRCDQILSFSDHKDSKIGHNCYDFQM